jgi:hypothetical protein
LVALIGRKECGSRVDTIRTPVQAVCIQGQDPSEEMVTLAEITPDMRVDAFRKCCQGCSETFRGNADHIKACIDGCAKVASAAEVATTAVVAPVRPVPTD